MSTKGARASNPAGKPAAKPDSRDNRLSDALRENLKKRKALARKRAGTRSSDPGPVEPPGSDSSRCDNAS